MTNDSPLAGFMDNLDAEEAAARREAVASIKQYDVERANEKTAEVAKNTAGTLLRNWLLTHPDEPELVDTEWQLRAYMQRGGVTRGYEHPNVVKRDNPKLYARLETLGMLRLDDDAVQKAVKEGLLTYGDLAGYVHEGERAQSLQVKKVGT